MKSDIKEGLSSSLLSCAEKMVIYIWKDNPVEFWESPPANNSIEHEIRSEYFVLVFWLALKLNKFSPVYFRIFVWTNIKKLDSRTA